MTATARESAGLPPRPLVRTFWAMHRFAHRVTGGRFGLRRPATGSTFGMLRLATVGRRTGRARVAIVGYFEDGQNLVTLAMNGWGQAEPAWWLNLQSNPDAEVSLRDGTRAVRARAAAGEERDRLWAAFRDYPGWGDDLDGLAARSGRTAVVVLEPRTTASGELRHRSPEIDGADAPGDPDRSIAAPLSRRFRGRHLWVVPGLAVAVYAGVQSDAHGFGPLLPLAFGLGPHLGVLLGLAGLGGLVAGRRIAALGIAVHNLLHHPVLPAALVLGGLAGLLSPWFLVAGGAWLGHIVIGWAVGDGHKAAADHGLDRAAEPAASAVAA
jgi:deazaflavin-dependent oxidoreductase (nitroreductase family)